MIFNPLFQLYALEEGITVTVLKAEVHTLSLEY